MSSKCILPWISIETTPLGNVRPCCLYRDELPDIDLKTHTLQEAFDSKAMRDLRRSFRRGDAQQTVGHDVHGAHKHRRPRGGGGERRRKGGDGAPGARGRGVPPARRAVRRLLADLVPGQRRRVQAAGVRGDGRGRGVKWAGSI